MRKQKRLSINPRMLFIATPSSILYRTPQLRVSVNKAYRIRKGGGIYKNMPEELVLLHAYLNSIPFAPEKHSRYAFYYTFIFPNRKRRDISNFIKVIEDAIFDSYLQDDDNKVYEMHIKKAFHKDNTFIVYVRWTKV